MVLPCWEIPAHWGNQWDFMVELYGSLIKIVVASLAFTKVLWDLFELLKTYDKENSNYIWGVFIIKDSKPAEILVEPVAIWVSKGDFTLISKATGTI